jgi:hypothetical protein
MPRIYWKIEQGTAAWFQLRAGIPTASCFAQIMTPKTLKPSEQRHRYACRLIAERLLNWQAESLDTIRHIEEGRANEPLAMGQLAVLTGAAIHKVGFITTDDGRFGASPDRAIGGNPSLDIEEGSLPVVVETKCPTIPKQMEYLLMGDNADYRCQRQGQLYVAEADKAIFYSFNPRMPEYLIEDGRDDEFIAKLADCLERFHDELSEMMDRARSLGTWEAYAAMVTPAEAEHGELAHDPVSEAEDWFR